MFFHWNLLEFLWNFQLTTSDTMFDIKELISNDNAIWAFNICLLGKN